jgi:hypothetical protein
MAAEARSERPLGELFTELARETGTLVRQEVQLAKTEMTGKAATAGRSIGLVAAGGALAHAGVLAILAAVIAGLGSMIPIWAAALLVGGLVAITGYTLVQKGLGALRDLNPAPTQTIQTLRDDKAWAKEQIP